MTIFPHRLVARSFFILRCHRKFPCNNISCFAHRALRSHKISGFYTVCVFCMLCLVDVDAPDLMMRSDVHFQIWSCSVRTRLAWLILVRKVRFQPLVSSFRLQDPCYVLCFTRASLLYSKSDSSPYFYDLLSVATSFELTDTS